MCIVCINEIFRGLVSAVVDMCICLCGQSQHQGVLILPWVSVVDMGYRAGCVIATM